MRESNGMCLLLVLDPLCGLEPNSTLDDYETVQSALCGLREAHRP